jgi:hypothetical protein
MCVFGLSVWQTGGVTRLTQFCVGLQLEVTSPPMHKKLFPILMEQGGLIITIVNRGVLK